jgi:glycosyltransferase involved in cell wall biosynthesis
LIVVNDDSTDATKTIAENSGARVIDVTLRNIGAVRNAGAAAAQGDWLLFVDADTVVPVPTFRRMISLMHQGVAGGGAIADIDDKPNVPWLKFLMYVGVSVAWQRLGRLAAGCFMFCRRDLFLGFGGFNEDFFAAEEFFFSRAVKRRGRFVLMSQPVLTSSRKLKSYSTTELFRFVSSFLFRGSSALKSRQSLDVLYEGRR